MNRKLDRLQDIRIENYIWVIYIIIIFISWYANSKEKKFILYNDEVSRREYQNLLVLIFSILLIIYYYFTKSSYDDLNELTINDSNKKIYYDYCDGISVQQLAQKYFLAEKSIQRIIRYEKNNR